MVNALFVKTAGVYFNVDGVEPWDIVRDAKSCKNGAPAICHPPCDRWGRYWSGGPSAKIKRLLGDDDGCFAFALWYVRTYGGVIEHPEASHAWKYYGLNKPPKTGGWIVADDYSGSTCCVEQGHYGHAARKATWLYACGVRRAEFKWGECTGKSRIDEGFHSKEKALLARAQPDFKPVKRLTEAQRIDTPIEFRDLLIAMINHQ